MAYTGWGETFANVCISEKLANACKNSPKNKQFWNTGDLIFTFEDGDVWGIKPSKIKEMPPSRSRKRKGFCTFTVRDPKLIDSDKKSKKPHTFCFGILDDTPTKKPTKRARRSGGKKVGMVICHCGAFKMTFLACLC